MQKKWYENNYRRHLCDMHIADRDDSFLSKFSADDYYENLKRANVSCAMLYYQSRRALFRYAFLAASLLLRALRKAMA